MYRARPNLAFVISLWIACVAGAAAEDADSTLSPYFFVEGGGAGVEAFPLLGTEVSATISGVIAEVRVRQVYRNDGAEPIHATYTFPASTRAAVHGLTMTLGGRRVRAQVRERKQARREYQKAKREGKSASLLEQERPNVFRMRVSNVMPGDRIEVELEYSELLVPTDGIYELVYPTVVGPRFTGEAPGAPSSDGASDPGLPYTAEGEPPAHDLTFEADLVAGMAIDLLESPSHDLQLDWQGRSRVHVVLDQSERDGGNRDLVLRYRLAGGQVQSGLILQEGEDESFFLLMVQPPRRVEPEHLPGREYVFVVDVSGSMSGFPLDTAKDLLEQLIGGLRPTDTFNVLFFSGGSRLLSPVSLPATADNVERALEMLSDQRGGGGTYLLAALKRALALPHPGNTSRSFIVVTDGYISAERSVFDHVRANLDGANVFSFGVGSSVNRHLIEGIARAGMGEPFVVLNRSEAPDVVARFRDYVASPVLTNVEVEFDDFQVHDVEPPSLPDVLAERPVIVHGKWSGEARGEIRLTGISGTGDYEAVLRVADASVDDGATPLRYLWARTRVANLMDFGSVDEAVKREVTSLGLKYSLLTRFTSFIAVHELVRNPGGEGSDVSQPLPLPEGVSARALGGRGSEPSLGLLLLALAACVAGWRLVRQAVP